MFKYELVRTLSKPYASQLIKHDDDFIIFNPFEKWFEKHNIFEVNLCSLEETTKQSTLILNEQCKDNLLFQSQFQLYEFEANAEMNKYKSQKSIQSESVMLGQNIIHINSEGHLQSFRRKQNNNPESEENKEQNEAVREWQIKLDGSKLVKNMINGRQLMPLARQGDKMLSLAEEEQEINVIEVRVQEEVLGRRYNCNLDKSMRKIISFRGQENTLFGVYGKQRLDIIDTRMQRVVLSFLSQDRTQISQVLFQPDNCVRMACGQKIVQIDFRNRRRESVQMFQHSTIIESFTFLKNEEDALAITEKNNGRVHIYKIIQ